MRFIGVAMSVDMTVDRVALAATDMYVSATTLRLVAAEIEHQEREAINVRIKAPLSLWLVCCPLPLPYDHQFQIMNSLDLKRQRSCF